MAARVNCKKGYNTPDGWVEFKKTGDREHCPISGAEICARCDVRPFVLEVEQKNHTS